MAVINSVEILSVPFTNLRKKTLINDFLHPRLQDNEKTFIVTANPEIVEYANKDSDYKKIISESDFIVPDGIGIVYASKILNNPLEERIAGFDLMNDLLKLADENKYRVFMLGAEQSVITLAAENVKKTYRHLNLVGYHHGYIEIDDAVLVKKISDTKPDIIFIALGFPKQEQWISNHMPLFDKGIFMGVGGSFDVLAGKVNRAPMIWQKSNLEWLYRLIKQPSRWRRMLVLPLFLIKVIREKNKR
ncbi:WecB/TagA/CpsF family glycosyltransferase [Bacillus sp. V59.32b]|uniref:WecB/TagA/CpsF family glycosyltransferase n=1 Tax=Bacillus sp. V59.32b TaxID=1758642 RepID=UPI000E3CFB43|nr:WecB/TagA/CpsF family glycosyltransferase [Bacillus sp. V59.32b]RFU66850.1 glycosyltransferase [Bacillus sp. V59.32b]